MDRHHNERICMLYESKMQITAALADLTFGSTNLNEYEMFIVYQKPNNEIIHARI